MLSPVEHTIVVTSYIYQPRMHIGVVATIPNFADRLQREGERGVYTVYYILYCLIIIQYAFALYYYTKHTLHCISLI